MLTQVTRYLDIFIVTVQLQWDAGGVEVSMKTIQAKKKSYGTASKINSEHTGTGYI